MRNFKPLTGIVLVLSIIDSRLANVFCMDFIEPTVGICGAPAAANFNGAQRHKPVFDSASANRSQNQTKAAENKTSCPIVQERKSKLNDDGRLINELSFLRANGSDKASEAKVSQLNTVNPDVAYSLYTKVYNEKEKLKLEKIGLQRQVDELKIRATCSSTFKKMVEHIINGEWFTFNVNGEWMFMMPHMCSWDEAMRNNFISSADKFINAKKVTKSRFVSPMVIKPGDVNVPNNSVSHIKDNYAASILWRERIREKNIENGWSEFLCRIADDGNFEAKIHYLNRFCSGMDNLFAVLFGWQFDKFGEKERSVLDSVRNQLEAGTTKINVGLNGVDRRIRNAIESFNKSMVDINFDHVIMLMGLGNDKNFVLRALLRTWVDVDSVPVPIRDNYVASILWRERIKNKYEGFGEGVQIAAKLKDLQLVYDGVGEFYSGMEDISTVLFGMKFSKFGNKERLVLDSVRSQLEAGSTKINVDLNGVDGDIQNAVESLNRAFAAIDFDHIMARAGEKNFRHNNRSAVVRMLLRSWLDVTSMDPVIRKNYISSILWRERLQKNDMNNYFGIDKIEELVVLQEKVLPIRGGLGSFYSGMDVIFDAFFGRDFNKFGVREKHVLDAVRERLEEGAVGLDGVISYNVDDCVANLIQSFKLCMGNVDFDHIIARMSDGSAQYVNDKNVIGKRILHGLGKDDFDIDYDHIIARMDENSAQYNNDKKIVAKRFLRSWLDVSSLETLVRDNYVASILWKKQIEDEKYGLNGVSLLNNIANFSDFPVRCLQSFKNFCRGMNAISAVLFGMNFEKFGDKEKSALDSVRNQLKAGTTKIDVDLNGVDVRIKNAVESFNSIMADINFDYIFAAIKPNFFKIDSETLGVGYKDDVKRSAVQMLLRGWLDLAFVELPVMDNYIASVSWRNMFNKKYFDRCSFYEDERFKIVGEREKLFVVKKYFERFSEGMDAICDVLFRVNFYKFGENDRSVLDSIRSQLEAGTTKIEADLDGVDVCIKNAVESFNRIFACIDFDYIMGLTRGGSEQHNNDKNSLALMLSVVYLQHGLGAGRSFLVDTFLRTPDGGKLMALGL